MYLPVPILFVSKESLTCSLSCAFHAFIHRLLFRHRGFWCLREKIPLKGKTSYSTNQILAAVHSFCHVTLDWIQKQNHLVEYTSSSSSNRPFPPLKRPLFLPNGENSSSSIGGGLNMSSLSSSAAATININRIKQHRGNNGCAMEKITNAKCKQNQNHCSDDE